MNTRRAVLISGLLPAFSANALGYKGWLFGMSRDDVKAVKSDSPYYPLGNGDLGSQAGPFEPGHSAVISFYFRSDRLVRVMLIPYMGEDFAKARLAWLTSAVHLTNLYGGIELGTSRGVKAPPAQADEAFEAARPAIDGGAKMQMGAFPMAIDVIAWCSASRMPNGQYIVTVSHAKP